MSGHNKWSSIKNKKGKEDAKRGKIFTKLARKILVAARDGGADPEYNPALKQAIDMAKSENMPNDNIERAIKKAIGDSNTQSYESITYEGYAPGAVAVIVNCLTDNKNRTAADIRHFFDKCDGNLGTNGSVMFMFKQKGILETKDKMLNPEELMDDALESGCEDVVERDDYYEITCDMKDFTKVLNGLSKYEFSRKEIAYIPENTVEVESEENRKKLIKLLDMLEDNDDVQEVYTNWNENID